MDQVLGGGLRLFSRAPGAPPSGAVVLRGPPGAGKSLMALQIASALARALEGDVFYACIELLPTELQAQLASIAWPQGAPRFVDLRRPEGDAGGRRLFCGSLALDPEDPAAHLWDSLEVLRLEVERLDGHPRVLVLDSLTSGYRLGREVPRPLVDGLCKLAAGMGWCVIFLEETSSSEPSPWCFAVDTVLELGFESSRLDLRSSALRTIHPSKHRFGRSFPGPHLFEIEHDGLRVYPTGSSYTSGFSSAYPVQDASWTLHGFRSWSEIRPFSWTASSDVVTFVHGSDPATVVRTALRVSHELGERPLHLPLSSIDEARGTPLSSDAWMAQVWGRLERNLPRSVAFGDLRALATFTEPTTWLHNLAILTRHLAKAGVSVVLYETTRANLINRDGHLLGWPETPRSLSLAGISVRIAEIETRATSIVDNPPIIARVSRLATGEVLAVGRV
ncbi:MAG: hypothetical protein MUF64_04865 [Polyangiaceae bacterium]|nr:hypothetical protein [Polyangiaceae bacterium]